jgi:hypothetical protein
MLTLLVLWFYSIKNRLFATFGYFRPRAASTAFTSAASSCAPGARVIEFYVPETFQAPQRRWLPPEVRGKVIEFSARRVKKSA